MLIKVIGIGVCVLIVNLVLKQSRPDIAILSNVCGGLLIFAVILSSVSDLINEFIKLQNGASLPIDIVSPVMKVIGIGYITEFTADLAEDSGNKSISSKILLGGKIAICSLAVPIVKKLITTIFSLI